MARGARFPGMRERHLFGSPTVMFVPRGAFPARTKGTYHMAHTLLTTSDAEDLVNQLNTFEENLADAAEVIDYQIPVLNSQGEIDDRQGPDCGATGSVQESRRALASYFTAWAFAAQPIQTKLLRLRDRQISGWLSLDEATTFSAA